MFKKPAIFAVVSMFVVALASATQAAPAPVTPECGVEVEAAKVGATPQCNYLAKCCAGDTPNAGKCCAGYAKHCGGER